MTIFREYDVRGIYGTELTEENIERIGKAFGTHCKYGNIALGRDTRVSGPSLQKAFLNGVLSTGCNVENYGVIPIPILSFITLEGHLNSAAYISASHNPPEYNGVRFRTSEGYGMRYLDEGIKDYYDKGNFNQGDGLARSCSLENAISQYRDYINDKINLKCKLRIVLDMGNGSAYVMESFYKELNYDTKMINGDPDGMFSGRGSAPTEKSLKKAAEYVKESCSDYGIGFDADADRGLVIDNLGRIIPPEKIAIIIAKKRYNPGDLLIAGLDCSMILEKELEPLGINVQRERVGDVNIANRVKNSGAVIGVERSAHFFLSEFQYSDDPFAMSLALGQIISEGEKLSDLADEIPDYPYKQTSIHLNEDPSGVMLRLKDALSRMEPDTMDGLKITTPSYSVLIRPSNTEPIIRLYIETTKNDMKDLEEKYLKIVHQAMNT